jgi:hypothetical protein
MIYQKSKETNAACRSNLLASVRTPEPSSKPVLLNMRQAARHVGISEQCFRKQHRAGIFPAVLLGDSKWFRIADLEAAIAKRVIRVDAISNEAA